MALTPVLVFLTSALLPAGSQTSLESEARALNLSWAETVFADRPAGSHPTNCLTIVHEEGLGDTKIGRCAFGTPMRLGEKTYTRGIGVNSKTVLRVTLAGPAARFLADIGLDRNVDGTKASVTMHVLVNGRERFRTPVLRPGAKVQTLDLPLDGTTRLDLVVEDGGDGRGWDQANWADARVLLQNGKTVWLDDLANAGSLGTGVPFSFVYGGQPSNTFFPKWQRQVVSQRLDDTRLQRTLVLTDPKTQLEVRAVCTIYTDTAGIDWTLFFTNKGTKDTPLLEQVKAVDVSILPGFGAAPVLHRLRGSTCAADDWLPLDDPLPPGKRVEFGAVNGRSSADSPFFNLDWGSAGVVTAVGWSGQWRGSVEHTKDRALRIQAGMEHLRLSLHPGETIRSPRILQLYWRGTDQLRACNLFRRTMLAHIVPRIDGQPVPPPLAHLSTSFYEMNQSTEKNVLGHLEALRGLGFEMFWVDAYWTRDGFPTGMGHYGFPLERAEPRDRFPRGLKAIGQAVHKEGLRYLMWFEPERVHPGTLLTTEHPEWVISPAKDGSGLYNLGLPPAREFMTRYLSTAIREYGLDCLRIDFNIDPWPFWDFLNKKDPNRVGLGEIRYIEGLYRMWDDLRKAHPHLFIDNCASGGRRIDLETCSRSIPLWRSDNTCDMTAANPETITHAALKNQLMSAGLNRFVPYSVVGQMGAEPYLFRSGFNGGIAFAEDCRPVPFPRELLRQALAEAKRIRKFWTGDFYPLSEVSLNPAAWCVTQFHRPRENDGILLAFRRQASPYASFDCNLQDIDPLAVYEVSRSADYTPEKPEKMKGDKLRRLRVAINDCPGSVIVEYRRLGP